MKLSLFIIDHLDEILEEWDRYARTMSPAADAMSIAALRDHAEEMLRAIALDIQTPQSADEARTKSLGCADGEDATSAASEHGSMRHASEFTLVQLTAEFRALRASVLRIWRTQLGPISENDLDDVTRFNEAIDQCLAESVAIYADRANQSSIMFDAILGHDLRAPLSSLTLAGEMLTRAELRTDRAHELGHRVKRAARYMTAMVDDLLEYARSRLGGGALPVHPQPVDLVQLCSGAIDDAKALHPSCVFNLVATSRLPAFVDPDRMHQLLVNLLANAGQHGSRGRPIELHLAGDEDEAVICVINDGRLISKESLQRIFDPMVRLTPDYDASNGMTTSLGLGLYIAREIAQGHGGSISAESDGRQIIFTVRVPRHAQAQSDGSAVSDQRQEIATEAAK